MASGKRRSLASEVEIVEHFERVHAGIEDLIRSCRGLLGLLKKRVAVDKEHVKALQKIASTCEDAQHRHIKFSGVLEEQWSEVKLGQQAEAMRFSSASSSLEQQALQPLQVYLVTDLEKRFHTVTQEGRRAVREYYSALSGIARTQDKYNSCASEWEASLLGLYREGGDAWAPAPGNKLYEREQVTSRKAQEARSEYEQSVSHVNGLQHQLCLAHLPSLLDTLHSIAESMAAVLHNALSSFRRMQGMWLNEPDAKPTSPALLDASAYVRKEIFRCVSHSTLSPPTPIQFTEYLFKDNALMVHTRKIQYQCMSVLTPQELFTRGAQLLSEKKSNGAAALQGLSPFLVEVCMEYLGKPYALGEEGLFRVPGDSAVMRSLHTQFLSPLSPHAKDKLRAAVMEQRDPNTVSGLLKLHLRENSVLCAGTCAALSSAMAGGQGMEGVLGVLVCEASSQELQLLTSLIELLAQVASDQWRPKNKMTPATLGIACGLSVFPQLEPGKATVLLQHLVKHCSELQQMHSVL